MIARNWSSAPSLPARWVSTNCAVNPSNHSVYYPRCLAHNQGAPAILRRGAFWRSLYSRSLGIALAALFVLSFVLHWVASARLAAEDAIEHGEAAPTVLAYLGDAQLWFESFQNWQSEFLSTAVLVVLSIFLRQRESPESKPVAAPP